MIMKYNVGDIIVTAFDASKIKVGEHDDPRDYTGWVRKIVNIVDGCYQLDESPWLCFEEDEIEGLACDVIKEGDIAKMKPFNTNTYAYILPIYEEMTDVSDEYVTIISANNNTFTIEENGYFYPIVLIDRIYPHNEIEVLDTTEVFDIQDVKPNISVRDFFDVCVFNENEKICITDSDMLFNIDITYSYDNEEEIYNIIEPIYDYKIVMVHRKEGELVRKEGELVILIDKAEN